WTRFKEEKIVKISDLFKDAILIPPLVHFGFCIVNWQGEEALIPFFPFIGIFAGYFVVAIARAIVAIPLIKRSPIAVRAIGLALVVPIVLIFVSVVHHARAYRIEPGRTLQDEQVAFQAVADILGPNDKVYV